MDVDGDRVRLEIPAEPGFLRLVRLTAAAVASRMGFTFDEVEDLRIAVDELCYFLLGGRKGAGTITVICSMQGRAITVEGVGRWPQEDATSAPGLAELPELSRRILQAVVDEYATDGTLAQPQFWLLKRRSASSPA